MNLNLPEKHKNILKSKKIFVFLNKLTFKMTRFA